MLRASNVERSITFYSSLDLAIKIIGFCILLLYTITNKHPIFWDEEWYYSDLKLIDIYGISTNFIINLKGPAGPMYQIVHYAFLPFTREKVPEIRLVNISFLIIIIIILISILKHYLRNNEYLNMGWEIMLIPMIFVCSGMALTEIPAMLFITICIFCFTKVNISFRESWFWAFIGGVTLSFGILGRQPYLLILPILITCGFLDKTKNKTAILLFFIFSIILPLYAFSIWKNIQPANQAQSGIGIAPWHGILGMGYAAIITILIAPTWFLRASKLLIVVLTAALICGLFINFKFELIYFLPMSTFIREHSSEDIIRIISLLFPCLVFIVGVYFIVSSVVRCWQNKHDIFYLFIVLSALILVVSSAKITHQFSSRYVAQAAPFFVLMYSRYIVYNKTKLLRSVIGISIGMMSLTSFF